MAPFGLPIGPKKGTITMLVGLSLVSGMVLMATL